MIVAGLTGSIAMGKSTVAAMLASLGCPVFDADAAVREFYRSEGAAEIEAAFPGVVIDKVVDRDRLAKRALGDKAAMAQLESIVHPAVARLRFRFLEAARMSGRRCVALDIPLLFETGGEQLVDIIVVVSATEANQRARALAREGMTAAKLEAILSRQMSDAEKRRRAHFVIDTNCALEQSHRQTRDLVRAIAGMPGRPAADA